MPITFIRTTPLPKCRYCKRQMTYYVPGLPDEEHSHDECEVDAMVEETLAIFRRHLNPDRSGAAEEQ